MTTGNIVDNVDRSESALAQRRQALADKGVTNGAEKPARAQRSDAGTTRGPFVEAPGVRFDLSVPEGRIAFKAYCWTTEQAGRDGIDRLLEIVDKLLRKHGAEKA